MPVTQKDVEWQSPGQTHNIMQLTCTMMASHMSWTTVQKCARGHTSCIMISCSHSFGAEITVMLFHHLLLSLSFYYKKTKFFRAGNKTYLKNNGKEYCFSIP